MVRRQNFPAVRNIHPNKTPGRPPLPLACHNKRLIIHNSDELLGAPKKMFFVCFNALYNICKYIICMGRVGRKKKVATLACDRRVVANTLEHS